MSAQEFLRSTGPILAPIGTVLLAIIYGIWLERSWSRHVIMAVGCVHVLVIAWLVRDGGVRGWIYVATFVLPYAGVAVYLYRVRGVVEYYRMLRAREARRGEFARKYGPAARDA